MTVSVVAMQGFLQRKDITVFKQFFKNDHCQNAALLARRRRQDDQGFIQCDFSMNKTFCSILCFQARYIRNGCLYLGF